MNPLDALYCHPLLPQTTVNQLVRRAQAGDATAMHAVMEANFRLIIPHARYYAVRCQHLEYDDLFNEGVFGLREAILGFDPDAGYAFSTYAVPWIRQKITRAIANQELAIRLPVHAGRDLRAARRAMGDPDQARDGAALAACFQTMPTAVSMEQLVDADPDSPRTILDTLVTPAPAPTAPEHSLSEWKRLFGQAGLTSREQVILLRRFGFVDGIDQSLETIGTALHLSRERVRQIEKVAMRKLRQCAPFRQHFEVAA